MKGMSNSNSLRPLHGYNPGTIGQMLQLHFKTKILKY